MIFDDAILKVKKKKANFRLNSFHRIYFGLACLKVRYLKVKTESRHSGCDKILKRVWRMLEI